MPPWQSAFTPTSLNTNFKRSYEFGNSLFHITAVTKDVGATPTTRTFYYDPLGRLSSAVLLGGDGALTRPH